MKKIVFFTGAGISAESGIKTFRDAVDGLYMDKEIEGALTKFGWKYKKQLVLDFHNDMRTRMNEVDPNLAHKLIAMLEPTHSVTIITQNVDDLHERAGSTNILHLHGELAKCRSTLNDKIYDSPDTFNVGDKCPEGSQLRPHTVLFGEMPFNIDESEIALRQADILVIVGTSLSITYTPQLLQLTKAKEIYYIDPEPNENIEFYLENVKYVEEVASLGMALLFGRLYAED